MSVTGVDLQWFPMWHGVLRPMISHVLLFWSARWRLSTCIGVVCLASWVAAAAQPADTDGDVYHMQMRVQPSFAKMQALGRQLFFDPALSGSGRMSCASCHDPRYAYGPPNALSVQPGGIDGQVLGRRAAPSLRYQQKVSPFTEHRFDDDFDDSVDQGPAGGHLWDGRAATLHAQAAMPLLASNEMANPSVSAIVAKLRQAAYAAQFRDTFGADALDDDVRAFKWATLALEMFQQDPAEFYPYSSKYDAVLRGQAQLTEQEARGLALFEDEQKGNCAACHQSRISPNTGAFPAFSDFGYVALGVPRHRQLPSNADPNFYDLGLCGPDRSDFRDKADYCGAFRTPTLRNVALRRSFFHNGIFHDLQQVLAFYATRDSEPQRWYPAKVDGNIDPFDDLPARYRGNVNVEPPFGRPVGEAPALSATEIEDVIAFLRTLTDGYQVYAGRMEYQ